MLYPTAPQIAELAVHRQQALLSQAAEDRLIRRSLGVSFPTARSAARALRSRLATGLRALAAWIDTQAAPPQIRTA